MQEHYDLRGVKGRTGTVTVRKAKYDMLSIQNDVGGHSDLPDGQYRVRVVKGWFDYESGKHYICELMDEKDVETARKIGTTGHTAGHFRLQFPTQPHLAEGAEKAAREFNPRIVYVSQFNFKMDRRVKAQKPTKVS